MQIWNHLTNKIKIYAKSFSRGPQNTFYENGKLRDGMDRPKGFRPEHNVVVVYSSYKQRIQIRGYVTNYNVSVR